MCIGGLEVHERKSAKRARGVGGRRRDFRERAWWRDMREVSMWRRWVVFGVGCKCCLEISNGRVE